MNLAQILNTVEVIQVSGNAESKEINAIEIDSRKVKDKSIFIALKGLITDGHKYIVQAISNGASAIVVEDDGAVPSEMFLVNDTVKILVQDSRKALSQIASSFYNFPSTKLKLIGITGTKGKTTTTYYLKNIIEHSGAKCGLIGTNKYLVGDREFKATHTTPEANIINYLLAEMVKDNCEFAVMEISSHSIAMKRVDNLDIDVMIFSNITSDHLDYHKTFENYRETKSEVFAKLKTSAKAVINLDDDSAKYFSDRTEAEVVFYGKNAGSAYQMFDINYTLEGTYWKVKCEDEVYNLSTKLIGEFNAYNATAAFAASAEAGIEKSLAVEGIKNAPQVPGRFETINHAGRTVIVDYSHTADSLEKALQAIRHLVGESKKVVTVFGCGGDRDKTKRPIMGRIAEEYSDSVIVTSDNPRTENPFAIIDEITAGMTTDKYKVIEKREEAIKEAIVSSEENTVILIAGKGHENYQEINGERTYFSDKETAEKFLSELNK